MKNKIYKGYGLKNRNNLLYKFFYLKKEAIKYAKYLVSNHKDMDWREVYKVVKVTLSED